MNIKNLYSDIEIVEIKVTIINIKFITNNAQNLFTHKTKTKVKPTLEVGIIFYYLWIRGDRFISYHSPRTV